MRLFKLSLTSAAVATFGFAAFADGHTAALEGAVKARNGQMGVIGYSLGLLGGMAKGEAPYDAATASAAAENLNAAASMNRIVMWIDGTEQGVVAGSRALPEAFSDHAGFEAKFVDLETATAAMVTAAGTDLASLQAAMGPVGAACGACHKAYRGPKN
ncbi:MAG: cytochrome c [Tateyamaria sp.]|uniref:c-type cytochrome n=1 Tax=Tateyamaria sp. TaxID=1929288 RepID=UPI00328AD7DB